MKCLAESAIATLAGPLRFVGLKLGPSHRVSFFEPVLYSRLRQRGQITFVQIGANDGKRFDPINAFIRRNRKRVSGIVVEPISEYFDRLSCTYSKFPAITPICRAVHATADKKTLFKIAPDIASRFSESVKGMASFDKGHLKRAGIPDEYIAKEEVTCITISRLLADHSITDLDLLQIDTEGYDAEIIRSFPFETVRPAIIHFEHGVPSGLMTRRDFSELAAYLHSFDYEIAMERFDATAYQIGVVVDQ